MTDQAFLMLSYVALLIFLGIACVLAPRRVQRFAERSVQMGPTARIERLVSFVSSDAFLWNVRATGMIALLMAAVLILASKI